MISKLSLWDSNADLLIAIRLAGKVLARYGGDYRCSHLGSPELHECMSVLGIGSSCHGNLGRGNSALAGSRGPLEIGHNSICSGKPAAVSLNL